MATVTSYTISEALRSIAESSASAHAVLPTESSVTPPENGISLLDAKNEIFLSYLQSLALRNLAVIRSVREFLPSGKSGDLAEDNNFQDRIVDTLIRKRVYLEKGVRPLEDRLKYTISKTLRAATEEERKAQQEKDKQERGKDNLVGRHDGSDSEDDSDGASSSGEEHEGGRANLASLASRVAPSTASDKATNRSRQEETTGAYRPPRIAATTMNENFDRPKPRKARPDRSRTLDEYVSNEMSEAPLAQPSVGSMIAQGGRHQISARERAVQAERTEYEETHLTRLMEKKDKGARKRTDGGFGGEDWRGLDQGLDRIDSLTRGTKKRDREGALEKSRKRRATEDGQRNDGVQAGGVFDKRKKRMMKKLR